MVYWCKEYFSIIKVQHVKLKRVSHMSSVSAHYVSSKLIRLRSAPSANPTQWRNGLPTVPLKRGELGTADPRMGVLDPRSHNQVS
jgi:hypothetical protein